MIKSKLVKSVYGKMRIVEGYKDYGRLYVKRTTLQSYVVSDSQTLAFDSMIAIDGLYHFDTLKELHTAMNTPCNSEQGQISVLYMSIVAILTGIIAGQSVIFNCLSKLVDVLR